MRQSGFTGTYACINLDNIVHNYKEACRLAGNDVIVSCVVKSDAYGHGEEQVVQALSENGCSVFCVSTIDEAIRLRNNFREIDILILGYTPKSMAGKVSEYNFIQTISSLPEANALNEAGPSKVHIKFNTGMNRLGFSPDEMEDIILINNMKNIKICGTYTHLHSSDSFSSRPSELQFDRFNKILTELRKKGINPGTLHVCNSGGIIKLPGMHMDMVRAGIMIYGLHPSGSEGKGTADLRESMELRSFIAKIFNIKKGEGISYGHDFIAPYDMKIATVNLGYSDGVFRGIGNKGEVIIDDRRRPIVGRVCMNMLMVDITGMDDVKVEDEVIVFGRDRSQFISIDEVAGWAGTISYEIICRTGISVQRVYFKDGKPYKYGRGKD
ncbi:MAG TPA: alanine racemase [Clostridia bacterium]|nr:alanine racemase [Clostridia bacterium]HRX41345.1 alanine racemase [Clostridia bacterium]